jgi:hypothetical protein
MESPEPMELKRLHLPARLRPVDFIVLVLLVALCLLQIIQEAELSELKKEIRAIETEGRP